MNAGHWFWISISARFVGYGWTALESFREYGMLRRRLELGLAEREVADRFFYWGVCTCAVELIWFTAAYQRIAVDVLAIEPSTSLVSAALVFIVAGSLWRAFFPSAARHRGFEGASAANPRRRACNE